MPGLSGTGWLVVLGVVAGLLIFMGANAHLVYVATISQPDCVSHLKDSSSSPGRFRAAKSAC